MHRFSTEILRGPLFTCIVGLPSPPLLFLLHISIFHALFTHINSHDTMLDTPPPRALVAVAREVRA
jgi:hypothetical protein